MINYKSFIFFSAGPVGDHAMILEFANRFFTSTKKPSFILSKHPNPFLSELSKPYNDHVFEIGVKGIKGYYAFARLIAKSIFIPYCYVLVFAIPYPKYIKIFSYFIRFFTRSRIIGLTSLCGFKSSLGPQESATFLGEGNYIKAHVDTKMFYEQADELLQFLGCPKVITPPELRFVENKEFLQKLHLQKNSYIVFHLVASSIDKSFPPDRWNSIITRVMESFPDQKIVFSGSVHDWKFIKECLGDIKEASIINLCGKATMSELLTVYSYASVTVTVHTGNAMLINMLHLRTVVVNIKGVYMFKYFFNKNAIECTGVMDCTCNPFERDCTLIRYKGKDYMACLFNNDDDVIFSSIKSQIHKALQHQK